MLCVLYLFGCYVVLFVSVVWVCAGGPPPVTARFSISLTSPHQTMVISDMEAPTFWLRSFLCLSPLTRIRPSQTRRPLHSHWKALLPLSLHETIAIPDQEAPTLSLRGSLSLSPLTTAQEASPFSLWGCLSPRDQEPQLPAHPILISFLCY